MAADSKSAAASSKFFDAAVIGGGVAGLSAAMSLARGCRKVLVIEDKNYRNAPAEHLHNLVAHDGQTPAEYRAQCEESVKKYPTTHFMNGTVTKIEKTSAENQPLLFNLHLKDGSSVQVRRIVLATGVIDELPAGIKEMWGKLVLHCPFCHGYEVKDRDWIINMNNPMAVAYTSMCAPFVRSHRLYMTTNGPAVFGDAEKKTLAANNVTLIEHKIAAIRQVGDKVEVTFEDNKHAPITAGAMFYKAHFHHPDVVTQLGCATKPDGTLAVDMFGKTSIPGVYAGGDNMDWRQQLSVAVGNGATAGIGCVMDLGQEDFAVRAAHAK